MPGTIGGIACSRVSGTLPAWREESQVWRIPGLDGFGIALLGRGDGETELRAVLYSSSAGVDAWAASLHALQGQIVAITTERGQSYASCFLVRVGNLVTQAARMPGTVIDTRGEIPLQVLIL